jgi:hypothetical protein
VNLQVLVWNHPSCSGVRLASILLGAPQVFAVAAQRPGSKLEASRELALASRRIHPRFPGRTEFLIPDLGADRTWRVVRVLAGEREVVYPPRQRAMAAVFRGSSLVNQLWF